MRAAVGDDNARHHLDFLRQAIVKASRDAAKWYEQRSAAHFESSVMSVNSITYQKLLARLKDDLAQWQTELESERADTLVRFNIQIYPVT